MSRTRGLFGAATYSTAISAAWSALSSHGGNHSRVLRDPSRSHLESWLIKNFKDPARESVGYLKIWKDSLKFLPGLPKIVAKILKDLQGSLKRFLKELSKLKSDTRWDAETIVWKSKTVTSVNLNIKTKKCTNTRLHDSSQTILRFHAQSKSFRDPQSSSTPCL